jgi:ribosome recycling factor
MDVSDLKGLAVEVKKRMDAQIEHVRRELSGVRTGRASVTILDSVHVEAYGSHMPINQVASLSIPEPTMIVAQPFDPSLMSAIEKAIRSSNLGLNPTNDGKVVRSRNSCTSTRKRAGTAFARSVATPTTA